MGLSSTRSRWRTRDAGVEESGGCGLEAVGGFGFSSGTSPPGPGESSAFGGGAGGAVMLSAERREEISSGDSFGRVSAPESTATNFLGPIG
jgi:hypothetical protein